MSKLYRDPIDDAMPLIELALVKKSDGDYEWVLAADVVKSDNVIKRVKTKFPPIIRRRSLEKGVTQ